jgi:predicted RNA-binding Zn ribbon-like protein
MAYMTVATSAHTTPMGLNSLLDDVAHAMSPTPVKEISAPAMRFRGSDSPRNLHAPTAMSNGPMLTGSPR